MSKLPKYYNNPFAFWIWNQDHFMDDILLCWCLKTRIKDMTLNAHMANEVLVDVEIIFKLMGKQLLIFKHANIRWKYTIAH